MEKDKLTNEPHADANPVLCAVPPERTMELCKAVMDYLRSKLNGDISPTPSLNSVACLAADIMKELRQA